jgi:hypothetical protein
LPINLRTEELASFKRKRREMKSKKQRAILVGSLVMVAILMASLLPLVAFAANPPVIGNGTDYGGYFEGTGSTGEGVYGYASNTGAGTNYGGKFLARGSTGEGVYGYASNTGAVTNYGGYFQAAGSTGRGVYGYATGGNGTGVYGYASNTGAVTNYGGYF